MTRYSDLAPLTIQEQEELMLLASSFFHPLHNEQRRKQLNLQPITPGKAVPLSVCDFLNWHKQCYGTELLKKQQRICEFFGLLESKKFLVNMGYRDNAHQLNTCYSFMLELTNVEKRGTLFLGKYLGLEFIAHKIKNNLVHILGTTKPGNESAGSGILITPQVVLTCKHVLEDMQLRDHVKIRGREYEIKKSESHTIVDFGVIILGEPVKEFCPDIALRKSTILEKIIIGGFPTVPFKIDDDTPIIQSGEITACIETYTDNSRPKYELFTAISRPGNSGGPVMSADGKLLGLVVKNLEGKYEEQQNTLPCFAAIPADVISKSFKDLDLSNEYSIPWEDYQ